MKTFFKRCPSFMCNSVVSKGVLSNLGVDFMLVMIQCPAEMFTDLWGRKAHVLMVVSSVLFQAVW